MNQEVLSNRMTRFREVCAEHGMAVTHQRMVIYQALAGAEDHPTPEAIYAKVRRKVPSISLATVYKSIKTFAELGLLREVSLLHESQRLDANLDHHYHLVCSRCKSVTDIPADAVTPVELRRNPPDDFRIQRLNVEVLGLCARCQATEA